MTLTRDESGVWTASLNESEVAEINPVVAQAEPRYLTIFDEIFAAAKRANELEFLFSLFRLRGVQDAGWDAVFHADYVLYGPEVRISKPSRVFSEDDVLTPVNRAIAYHSALATIFKQYAEAYDEPITIPSSRHFRGDPELSWRLIVRDGYGAAGVKDAWSSAQLRSGKIPVRLGRFFEDELRMLNNDPMLDRLPRRNQKVIL